MSSTIHKILIIDDNPHILRTIGFLLLKLGYSIVKLNNSIKSLETTLREMPDLVIVDWCMEGMDGLEVLQKLKDNPYTKEIPVIICSGMKTESNDLKTAMDLGASDFLRKPIDKIELAARTAAAIKAYEYLTSHKGQKEPEPSKTDDNHSPNNWRYESEPDKKHQALIKDIFYLRLTNSFPELTANERKLCAYFRLDMSNKDISLLTFSSYNAIRKARYRLRKKLNLKVDQDLTAFLISLESEVQDH